MTDYIVNYHPCLSADINLFLTSRRLIGIRDYLVIERASAVLLPHVCRSDLHALVMRMGIPHFPKPIIHLGLDGKVGNYILFFKLRLPTPHTLIFNSCKEAADSWESGSLLWSDFNFDRLLVVKGASGGEGRNVFFIKSPRELRSLENKINKVCFYGIPGLIIQEFVDGGGRDLRVVLVGHHKWAYWRVGRGREFRNNLSQGGYIDSRTRGEDIVAGLSLANRFQKLTKIDIIGVDILIPSKSPPLLLEVNFYFGRYGLGGSQLLQHLYLSAVRYWLSNLGLDPGRVRLI